MKKANISTFIQKHYPVIIFVVLDVMIGILKFTREIDYIWFIGLGNLAFFIWFMLDALQAYKKGNMKQAKSYTIFAVSWLLISLFILWI